MDTFLQLAKSRYSCRGYMQEPVSEKDLEYILEAARYAPTATNKQAFKIVVIDPKKHSEKLKNIYDREWFYDSPLVIAVFSSDQSWTRSYDNKNIQDVDASIVMDHITLAAADLGLGSCWICNFDPDGVRGLVDLPDEYTPLAFTPIGYPDDQGREKLRKPLSDITIRLDQFPQ